MPLLQNYYDTWECITDDINLGSSLTYLLKHKIAIPDVGINYNGRLECMVVSEKYGEMTSHAFGRFSWGQYNGYNGKPKVNKNGRFCVEFSIGDYTWSKTICGTQYGTTKVDKDRYYRSVLLALGLHSELFNLYKVEDFDRFFGDVYDVEDQISCNFYQNLYTDMQAYYTNTDTDVQYFHDVDEKKGKVYSLVYATPKEIDKR